MHFGILHISYTKDCVPAVLQQKFLTLVLKFTMFLLNNVNLTAHKNVMSRVLLELSAMSYLYVEPFHSFLKILKPVTVFWVAQEDLLE